MKLNKKLMGLILFGLTKPYKSERYAEKTLMPRTEFQINSDEKISYVRFFYQPVMSYNVDQVVLIRSNVIFTCVHMSSHV